MGDYDNIREVIYIDREIKPFEVRKYYWKGSVRILEANGERHTRKSVTDVITQNPNSFEFVYNDNIKNAIELERLERKFKKVKYSRNCGARV